MIRMEILPRQTMTWSEFVKNTPAKSIALDGMVKGGPAWDEKTLHANFDHHEAVVREATMSTANQVLFAIKGGIMDRLQGEATLYVNDCDQDTVFACWLVKNYKKFDGDKSHPVINRLLALNDRWDITGGAFPMSLDDALVRQHCWVFEPYTDLRKFGHIVTADRVTMQICFEACMARLDKALMGQAEEKNLDTRYEFLHADNTFKVVREIGGNEARYHLFSKGLLNAYVSVVATRSDNRIVYTVGRRSRYVDFPVRELYHQLSEADTQKLRRTDPNTDHSMEWGGSDIIGGSDRFHGSLLTWEEVRDVITEYMTKIGN